MCPMILVPDLRLVESVLEKCRDDEDFMPAAFEALKQAGLLAGVVLEEGRMQRRARSETSFGGVLILGMLHRSISLVNEMMTLCRSGQSGDGVSILARCIYETCLKLIWLAQDTDGDRQKRYMVDGIKAEMELVSFIEAEIKTRGSSLQIERNMLSSIERLFAATQLSPEDAKNCRGLPDLASVVQSLGQIRLMYTVLQKIASHDVHGSVASLLAHYLEGADDGGWDIREEPVFADPRHLAVTVVA